MKEVKIRQGSWRIRSFLCLPFLFLLLPSSYRTLLQYLLCLFLLGHREPRRSPLGLTVLRTNEETPLGTLRETFRRPFANLEPSS